MVSTHCVGLHESSAACDAVMCPRASCAAACARVCVCHFSAYKCCVRVPVCVSCVCVCVHNACAPHFVQMLVSNVLQCIGLTSLCVVSCIFSSTLLNMLRMLLFPGSADHVALEVHHSVLVINKGGAHSLKKMHC
jgi:hypothetical protein